MEAIPARTHVPLPTVRISFNSAAADSKSEVPISHTISTGDS